MKLDSMLTSLLLSRSQLHRRNREIWTDLDWQAVITDSKTKVLELKGGKVKVVNGQLSLIEIADADKNLVWLDLGVDQDQINYIATLDETSSPEDWQDLRQVGATLSDLHTGLLVTSLAMFNWHKHNKFCAYCGAQTIVDTAGWTRRCESCQVVHHPRTDAAIICLVVDESDRILLGSRVDWSADFFSTFAGFVESGESAEMTVIRELREEAGVEVAYEDIQYRGSQVWPFPQSLMLGYRALTKTSKAQADGYEISEVRWYSRAELAADCESGKLKLPSKISIARALIEEWFGEPLNDAWLRP
ncbi:MAG: NAD(+) diphosphatase [Candidatus Nanopelagicales bacterium]